jgi:hypothetical protein
VPTELSLVTFGSGEEHVELVRRGVIVLGTPIARVLGERPLSSSLVQHAVSWDDLLGANQDLRVDRAGLRAAMRRFVGWKQLVEVISNVLARARYPQWPQFKENVTRWALEDSWPASVQNFSVLMTRFKESGRDLRVVTDQALLSMLTDALREPWGEATEPAPDPTHRILRLAMIANAVLVPQVTPQYARRPEPMLAFGSIRSNDAPVLQLVRAYEIYGEILPEVFPGAAAAFERATGIGVARWITDVCRIAQAAITWLKRHENASAGINLDPAQPDVPPGFERVSSVADVLSATPGEFREELLKLDQETVDRGLAFEPIRQRPLLRDAAFGEHQVILLHLDFLLSAADDGVYHRVLPQLSEDDRPRFLERFGVAFERYVERVLTRCASRLPDSRVVGLTASKAKRCDFAWRIGDDLVLVDAKRWGVTAAMLMGVNDLSAWIDERLAGAAEQLIATADGIDRGDIPLASAIGRESGWRPRRLFGLIVHHHPLFLWYTSTRESLARQGAEARWDRLFMASPLAWSVSELELFEAAATTFDVEALLSALASGHSEAGMGLRGYLNDVGWRGRVSPHVEERFAKILRQEGV